MSLRLRLNIVAIMILAYISSGLPPFPQINSGYEILGIWINWHIWVYLLIYFSIRIAVPGGKK